MPTTTNFGWTTPADTDLVKDGALAIRTLGNGIDTSLVDLKGGTTGQVLSKASNTDMDFTWVAQDDSNAIQNAIIDAKGDLIVGTAADTPARLAVGTNGQVLTVDSTTASGLKWATASGGGKILQVVNVMKTDSFTTTSTTFTDVTGLSASITPSATSSKILVLATLSMQGTLATNAGMSRLLRDSTTIIQSDTAGSRDRTMSMIEAAASTVAFTSANYLDSPASTSALTYKIQVRNNVGGQTVFVNRTNTDTDAIGWGRSVSSITLLEVGA